MAFEFPQKVLFKHCDPAGIVFYPRYFEMMNDCIEAFFDEVVGTPFEELHREGGVPTAAIETRFIAPSRHGDHLLLTLTVETVGRSSCGYLMRAASGSQPRFETRGTLVMVNGQGRPVSWPGEIRTRLIDSKEGRA